MERVQTDNEWVEKFAAGATSAAQVVRKMTLALTFRNILGVNYLTEYSFPQEIYKIGFITPIGKDREGRHILLIRNNRWRKSPELYELMKKFIVYQFEKIDLIKPFPDFTVICDFAGVEQANIDRDMLDFNSETFDAYTRSKTLPLTVNLPQFMTSLVDQLSLGATDKSIQKNKFIKSEQLTQYIDLTVLPKYLGGTNDKPLNTVPESQFIKGLDAFGFSDADIQKIKTTFASQLN